MNKQEFFSALRMGLSGLPQKDIEERLLFYSEMIDDRMEEGLSEEEAVAAVGSVEEIASQVVEEIPLAKIAKERIKPKRRLRVGEILLLALGAPIWLSLGIAALAVIFLVYVSLWSVIISLWAVFVSFAVCGVAGVIAGIGFVAGGHTLSGLAVIGAACVCAGLGIFVFYGCKAATKGIVLLTKKIAIWTKSCFIKKEDAQ